MTALTVHDEHPPLRRTEILQPQPEDAPGAEPPQCVLLAVSPNLNEPWSIDALEAVVYETLDLAQIRAVDTAALQGGGHYLPGIFLAYNLTKRHAVSSDVSRLARA
jgi:hypothetical protein